MKKKLVSIVALVFMFILGWSSMAMTDEPVKSDVPTTEAAGQILRGENTWLDCRPEAGPKSDEVRTEIKPVLISVQDKSVPPKQKVLAPIYLLLLLSSQ